MPVRKSGFTLIELLIVVAIIGILASIAAVNFLNAQVRAKVARAHSEINVLKLGLELYNVDRNNYPLDYNAWFPGGGLNDYDTWVVLTTPVEYLSTFPYAPWLVENMHHNPYDENLEVYIYGGGPPVPGNSMLETQSALNKEVGVYYIIQAAGPDLDGDFLWGPPEAIPLMDRCLGNLFFIYNPTNGVVSSGDILATNKKIYR